MNSFATQIRRVTDAIKPLATEMNKVAAGFSAFPARIQKLITQNGKLANSNKKAANSYGVLGSGISRLQVKLGLFYYTAKRVGNIIGGWINKATAYIENVNLFSVSMGKYAEDALSYAESVRDSLGIDLSEWIRYQGVFKEIAVGFGVAEDAAYSMSTTLNQLAYDLSSYWNISVETAMEKLQSGLTGQVKPMLELGVSLHAASLEQEALSLGITKSVRDMTQAEKTTLRYVTMLNKSKNALGDLSRTLITPANAIRTLQAQINQLTIALGNMFIPILIKVILYVQAFVIVLTEAAQEADERLCSLINGFIKDVWSGTATDLCDGLKTLDGSFNYNPAVLGKKLTASTDFLKDEFGITADSGKKNKRFITLSRTGE